MLRFLFRLWLVLVLFFIGLLFGRRPSSDSDDPRQRVGSRRRRGAVSKRGIDRSDVVDVPFTEIPPPDGADSPDHSESARSAARPEHAARPNAASRSERAAGLP